MEAWGQPPKSLFHYDHRYELGDPGDDPDFLTPQYCISGGLRGVVPRSALIRATGQATNVREHSALLCGDLCVVAIGAYAAALHLPSLDLAWYTPADSCDSCNKIYHAPQYNRLIVWGECEITCLSYGGAILWSLLGSDVFVYGLKLYEDYVEALDFNGLVYYIDLATGALR